MGSSLPPSSAHRLPTVSASEALKQIQQSGSQTLPTGLSELDELLVGSALSSYGRGGIVRGQLTEIFGPPGSGKTAIGTQLATRVVSEGNNVVWIDCAQQLAHARLDTASGISSKRFHAYYTPTAAHILALVHRPAHTFPPSNTHLMVVDDVSALFPPQYVSRQKKPATPKPGLFVQQTLLGALNRIASGHNVAVVVLSHVSTKIRTVGAYLVPAQDSRDWDDGFASRIAVFRDFTPSFGNMHSTKQSEKELLARFRYAGVVKAHGLNAMDQESFKDIVAFGLNAKGRVVPMSFSSDQIPANVRSSPVKTRKRRLNEIPDTKDDWSDSLDEYSWDEDEIQIIRAQSVESRNKRPKADQTPEKDAADNDRNGESHLSSPFWGAGLDE